jgi:ribose transport system permease protein
MSAINWRNQGAWIAFAVIWLGLGIVRPGALTPDNLVNILRQVSPDYMLAIGATLVIISGGIDLSPGTVLGLAGMVAGMTMQLDGLALGIVAGIAAAVVCGAVSGGLIAWTGMWPFVATLGVMSIARGLTYALSGGRAASDLPEAFFVLGRGNTPIIIALALGLIAHLLLTRSAAGRRVYALGGNEQAAFLSGVLVRRLKTWVYATAGLCTGIGAMVFTSRLQSAQVEPGIGLELRAIGAAVIGGTSLMGGQGSVIGTLAGALIIGTIQNALNQLQVQAFWHHVVVGAVIIAAALLDRLVKQRGGRA